MGAAARERQQVRFHGSDIICNSDMRVAEVRKFCKLDEAGDSLVRAAMSRLNLLARGYHRVLKLARKIADLAGNEDIQSVHLAEALQYRSKVLSYIVREMFLYDLHWRSKCRCGRYRLEACSPMRRRYSIDQS